MDTERLKQFCESAAARETFVELYFIKLMEKPSFTCVPVIQEIGLWNTLTEMLGTIKRITRK